MAGKFSSNSMLTLLHFRPAETKMPILLPGRPAQGREQPSLVTTKERNSTLSPSVSESEGIKKRQKLPSKKTAETNNEPEASNDSDELPSTIMLPP
jgi:hypothetical protein